MATETVFVIQMRVNPDIEWRDTGGQFTREDEARPYLDANREMLKGGDFSWEYRLVKRTTTIEEVIVNDD